MSNALSISPQKLAKFNLHVDTDKIPMQHWKLSIQYAHDCIIGTIPSNKLMIKSCIRFLLDLDRKDLTFDAHRVQDIINFRKELSIPDGKAAGEPLKLMAHEIFLIANLYGFYKTNDLGTFTNRYKECNYFVPRGNSKTAFSASLVAITSQFALGSCAGAGIFSIATNEEQAFTVHKYTKAMVEHSNTPAIINSLIQPTDSKVNNAGSTVSYKPLSSSAKSAQGKRIALAVCDEISQYSSDATLNAMTASANSSSVDPLVFKISSSGYSDVYIDTVREAQSVLFKGDIPLSFKDDTFYQIYMPDKEDAEYLLEPTHPHYEALLKKCNPALGVIISSDNLKSLAVSTSRSKQIHYQIYNLNVITTDSGSEYIPHNQIERAFKPDSDALKFHAQNKTPCYLGLDLANSQDLLSLSMLFYEDGILPQHFSINYIPSYAVKNKLPPHIKAKIEEINASDESTKIIECEVLDFEETVLPDIKFIKDNFNVIALGFDRYGTKLLLNKVEKQFGNLQLIDVPQTYVGISDVAHELQSLFVSNKITITDETTKFCLSNSKVARTQDGKLIKVVKAKDEEKIDGTIALLCSLATSPITEGAIKFDKKKEPKIHFI